jgi:hypothetical protein
MNFFIYITIFTFIINSMSVTECCTRQGCQRKLHTSTLCHTHYQQDYRKAKAASVSSSHDQQLTCTDQLPSSSVLSKSIEVLSPLAVTLKEVSDECLSSSSSEDSDDEIFQRFSVESIHPAITKELMQHQFYPGGVYPASPEVHVLPSGQRADNIGWALKSHRTRTQFSTGSKIRTVACAGCLVCPDRTCPFKARPNSKGVSSLKVCGNVAMHGGQPPQLILQDCSAKFVYSTDIATGVVTLTATCHSSHDRPPPKGPSPATLAMIQQHMQITGQKLSSSQMLKDSAAVSQDAGAQDATQLQRYINTLFKTTAQSPSRVGRRSVTAAAGSWDSNRRTRLRPGIAVGVP